MSASKHDWGLIFAGVALAAAGFFCMLAPGLTIVTIAAVVGAFFLVAGVFDIISYIRLRNISRVAAGSLPTPSSTCC